MNATNQYTTVNGQIINKNPATEWELRNLKGIIYLFYNKTNRKVLVGQSNTTFYLRYSVDKKLWWKEASNIHFSRALQKQLAENFEVIILESNVVEQPLLDFLEKRYISLYKSNENEYGYNKTSGGFTNSKFSPEVIEKLSVENWRGHRDDRKREFIRNASETHPGLYCYDKIDYINCDKKVEIFCFKCQKSFFQSPYRHVNYGNGCPTCLSSARLRNKLNSFMEYIKKCDLKFGKTKFVYNYESYFSYRSLMEIHCNNCRTTFKKSPRQHLSSRRGCCPNCSYLIGASWKRKAVAKINPYTNEIVEKFGSYTEAVKKYGNVGIQQGITKNYTIIGFKWKYI